MRKYKKILVCMVACIMSLSTTMTAFATAGGASISFESITSIYGSFNLVPGPYDWSELDKKVIESGNKDEFDGYHGQLPLYYAIFDNIDTLAKAYELNGYPPSWPFINFLDYDDPAYGGLYETYGNSYGDCHDNIVITGQAGNNATPKDNFKLKALKETANSYVGEISTAYHDGDTFNADDFYIEHVIGFEPSSYEEDTITTVEQSEIEYHLINNGKFTDTYGQGLNLVVAYFTAQVKGIQNNPDTCKFTRLIFPIMIPRTDHIDKATIMGTEILETEENQITEEETEIYSSEDNLSDEVSSNTDQTASTSILPLTVGRIIVALAVIVVIYFMLKKRKSYRK